jgi:hypothetical protein
MILTSRGQDVTVACSFLFVITVAPVESDAEVMIRCDDTMSSYKLKVIWLQ